MASSGSWTIFSRLFKAEFREVGNSTELYLRLTRECMEQADRMTKISTLPKFNYEQCKYLSDKLKMVVQSANSFLELINTRSSPSVSIEDNMVQPLEIFKLLFVLGKEVESFIGGCCKDPWIQSAIMLTNVSEHVSSLGMNLEICRIGFSNKEKSGELPTLKVSDFVSVKEAEIQIIKLKASLDESRLIKAVSALIQSCDSSSIDWQLANFLRERLERERLKSQRQHLGPDLQISNVSTYFEILDKGLNQGQRLGGGSFGTVYKAKWFGADVAKKIFQGVSGKEFFHEVSILEGLRHPNIVSLLWYMRDLRKCYLIMELMDGDLLSLIQERLEGCGIDDPPFCISEALHIMLQVGEGMLFLHEKRIVHRDLKSQNILVRYVKSKEVDVKYVQVKVADFGLSRTKDKSMTTSLLTVNQGTTRWMAPELIKTANDDGEIELSKCEERLQYPFKVDVYSFGMLCYEILSGKVPFSSFSLYEVKKKVLVGDHPQLPDQCPERLKIMIKKCWSPDPSKRPRFEDICAELRHLRCAHLWTFDRPLVHWKLDQKQAISELPSPSRMEGAIPSQQSSWNQYQSKEIREENVDMTDRVKLELGQGRVDEEHEVAELSRVKATQMIKWLQLLVAGWIVAGSMAMILNPDTFVAKILSPFKRLAIDPLNSLYMSISPSTFLSLCYIFVVGVSTRLFWKLSNPGELTPEDAEGAIPTRQPLKNLPPVGSLKEYRLKEIVDMTDRFSLELGRGSQGIVYFASLPEEQGNAAVKRLQKKARTAAVNSNLVVNHNQELIEEEFWASLGTISRLHHRNLVALLGYCVEEDDLFLVYEFMTKGSLRQHLHALKPHKDDEVIVMDWKARMRCAVDVAQGLKYLHSHVNPSLVHLDIKSGNILFDKDMNAKIADFGLSQAVISEPIVAMRHRGTEYVDPEYLRNGQPCDMNDVYSYGIILLELITGRHAVHQNFNLLKWCRDFHYTKDYVMRHFLLRVVDSRMNAQENISFDQVFDVMKIARNCVQERQGDRPTMQDVVVALYNVNFEELSTSSDLNSEFPITQVTQVIYATGDSYILCRSLTNMRVPLNRFGSNGGLTYDCSPSYDIKENSILVKCTVAWFRIVLRCKVWPTPRNFELNRVEASVNGAILWKKGLWWYNSKSSREFTVGDDIQVIAEWHVTLRNNWDALAANDIRRNQGPFCIEYLALKDQCGMPLVEYFGDKSPSVFMHQENRGRR